MEQFEETNISIKRFMYRNKDFHNGYYVDIVTDPLPGKNNAPAMSYDVWLHATGYNTAVNVYHCVNNNIEDVIQTVKELLPTWTEEYYNRFESDTAWDNDEWDNDEED